jgi:hypothetical protein
MYALNLSTRVHEALDVVEYANVPSGHSAVGPADQERVRPYAIKCGDCSASRAAISLVLLQKSRIALPLIRRALVTVMVLTSLVPGTSSSGRS